MKTRKNVIKICIGIGIIVIIFLFTFFIKHKNEEVELGMSIEKAMSILDKSNYKYETNETNGDGEEQELLVRDIVFCGISGLCVIEINSENKVKFIYFNFDLDDLDKKVITLKKYLNKVYGEPIGDTTTISNPMDNTEIYIFQKNNIKASIFYPTSEDSFQKSITVGWYYADSY